MIEPQPVYWVEVGQKEKILADLGPYYSEAEADRAGWEVLVDLLREGFLGEEPLRIYWQTGDEGAAVWAADAWVDVREEFEVPAL